MLTLSSLPIKEIFDYENLMAFARALAYVVIGFLLGKFVSHWILQIYQKQKRPRYGLLLQKFTFYTIFILFTVSGLKELGFDLKILLGATGILTVALGFASQTSASNFISGLFLLGEDAFHVGDNIIVNGITGEITSVDLFSIKLKQNDNTLVRIPNEMLLKNPVTNLSYFRERAFYCYFTLSSGELKNLSFLQLRDTIINMLVNEPLCLNTPAPSLEIKEFSDNGIKVQLIIWANQENFSRMKYFIQEKLIELLNTNHISIADSTTTVKLINTDNA